MSLNEYAPIRNHISEKKTSIILKSRRVLGGQQHRTLKYVIWLSCWCYTQHWYSRILFWSWCDLLVLYPTLIQPYSDLVVMWLVGVTQHWYSRILFWSWCDLLVLPNIDTAVFCSGRDMTCWCYPTLIQPYSVLVVIWLVGVTQHWYSRILFWSWCDLLVLPNIDTAVFCSGREVTCWCYPTLLQPYSVLVVKWLVGVTQHWYSRILFWSWCDLLVLPNIDTAVFCSGREVTCWCYPTLIQPYSVLVVKWLVGVTQHWYSRILFWSWSDLLVLPNIDTAVFCSGRDVTCWCYPTLIQPYSVLVGMWLVGVTQHWYSRILFWSWCDLLVLPNIDTAVFCSGRDVTCWCYPTLIQPYSVLVVKWLVGVTQHWYSRILFWSGCDLLVLPNIDTAVFCSGREVTCWCYPTLIQPYSVLVVIWLVGVTQHCYSRILFWSWSDLLVLPNIDTAVFCSGVTYQRVTWHPLPGAPRRWLWRPFPDLTKTHCIQRAWIDPVGCPYTSHSAPTATRWSSTLKVDAPNLKCTRSGNQPQGVPTDRASMRVTSVCTQTINQPTCTQVDKAGGEEFRERTHYMNRLLTHDYTSTVHFSSTIESTGCMWVGTIHMYLQAVYI